MDAVSHPNTQCSESLRQSWSRCSGHVSGVPSEHQEDSDMGDHHDIPSFEPDELGSSSVGIFIIAVAVFVAVSIVGVAVWLDHEVDLVMQSAETVEN